MTVATARSANGLGLLIVGAAIVAGDPPKAAAQAAVPTLRAERQHLTGVASVEATVPASEASRDGETRMVWVGTCYMAVRMLRAERPAAAAITEVVPVLCNAARAW